MALLDTGTIPAAEKLRAKYPAGLVELTRLPGLGPKQRAQAVRRARHRLARGAARGGRAPSSCATSAASGPSSRRRSCRPSPPGWPRRPAPRTLLHKALAVGDAVVGRAARAPGRRPRRARRLGPPRRRRRQGPRHRRHRLRSPGAAARARRARPRRDLLAPSDNAARGRGRTPDCRSTCASSSPTSSATCCSTSPAPRRHNMALREAAVRRGLHVSEYGILDDATGDDAPLRDRGAGLRAARAPVDLPELRENTGEIQKPAEENALPPPDREVHAAGRPAHAHHGEQTAPTRPRAMAPRRTRGWAEVHRHHRSHEGRDGDGRPRRACVLLQQLQHLEQVRRDGGWKGLRFLAGIEVDILPDGSLRFRSRDSPRKLDWVIGSIHTAFGDGRRGA